MTTTKTTKQLYSVTYSGNSSRFNNFTEDVLATSQRDAVEQVFSKYLNDNYYPQDDGSILDCDGDYVAEDANDIYFAHDGGYFYAETQAK